MESLRFQFSLFSFQFVRRWHSNPPANEMDISIRSSSRTTVESHACRLTTSRFSSTATRCDGNEKSSSSRLNVTSALELLDFPFIVTFIH
jgi:hypothetical protein